MRQCGLLDPKPSRLPASERHQHFAMTSTTTVKILAQASYAIDVHNLGVPCREVALRVGAAVAHEAIQGGGASIEGQLREGLRGVTSKAARLHIIGDYLQRLQYNPFRNASAVT